MKKFEKLSDIPDFPGYNTPEEYQEYIREFIEAGAIPKKDLITGNWYLGNCRNSSIARWIGNEFQYIRNKFGTYYIENINHFEDDDGYDLFVPFKSIEIDYE